MSYELLSGLKVPRNVSARVKILLCAWPFVIRTINERNSKKPVFILNML